MSMLKTGPATVLSWSFSARVGPQVGIPGRRMCGDRRIIGKYSPYRPCSSHDPSGPLSRVRTPGSDKSAGERWKLRHVCGYLSN